VTLIDSAEETARDVAALLQREGLERADGGSAAHTYLVSDLPDQFLRVGRRFLGERISHVEVVRAGSD
jgi:glutamate racemase